jgi:hypothetical protein
MSGMISQLRKWQKENSYKKQELKQRIRAAGLANAARFESHEFWSQFGEESIKGLRDVSAGTLILGA